MSSFLAAAPLSPEPGLGQIANDGFFPDLDLADATAAMRQDGTVTPERLRAALVEAVLSVNGELAAWRLTHEAAGYASLESVPAAKVDGRSAHQHRYLRAVYCQARASLIERYRDYDATAAGDRQADKLELSVDDLRRDARWAISDMMGISRTTVELI